MPQPAATQAPDKEAQEKAAKKAEQEKALQEWTELVEAATEGDGSPQRQIKLALELERQRADLMEQISSNRQYLRFMQKGKELNEDQTEFLETFYPEKEKGNVRDKSDVEATRRARAAARRATSNGGDDS